MPVPNDTDPKVARLQIELLRQAGPERRLEIGFGLTAWGIEASRQKFFEKYAERSKALLEWVRFVYGTEIAQGLERNLQSRQKQ